MGNQGIPALRAAAGELSKLWSEGGVYALGGGRWAVGKRQITRNYAWYLAEWSKRMSWQEVAEAFRISWHRVFCSVEMAVT